MFPFPNIFLSFPNKVLLLILVAGIALIPAGYVLKHQINALDAIAQTVAVYAALSLLLQNGKFVYTAFAQYVNFSIAVVLIGAMFKIMHWPGADILLLGSLCSIAAIYVLYFFISKKEYTLLSILKLGFVLSFIAARLFILLHLPYGNELFIGNLVLLGITVPVFAVQNFSTLKNT